MTVLKKALSLMLCVIMAFSCFSLTGVASDNKAADFSYSLKYYTTKSDAYNIDKVLDKVDELLKQKNFSVSVKVSFVTITLDLSSIDAVCETIDDFGVKIGNLIKLGSVALRGLIGDLVNFDMSTWKTGMKRGAQDSEIVTELIELLYANKEIVKKLCNGTLDAGVFTEALDLDRLVGKDGIGGVVKKFLIGLVYEKDSAEYNKAYDKYKDKIDSFIYGELLSKYAGIYLPGFTMDETSTVEDLICVAFGLVAEKYIKPLISNINIDTAASENPSLRALHGLVNLKGSTYDFSGIKFDPDKSFLSQVNNVVGVIVNQLIPGYKWKSGSYDKISENIEGAFKYLGRESGLIENADSLSFDETVMQVISIIAESEELQGLGDGVSECRSLEDMAKMLLINLTKTLGFDISYKKTDSYLLVLGDVASALLYNWFDIKDLNGNSIAPGMGYDIFEVANFALNYLLFDKQLASFIGLNATKTESVFSKADKLIDYFGESKSVNFDSEKFLMGDGKSKGLLEAFFGLDIEYIIEMTAVPALKNAGDVSMEKFLYNTVRYFLNNMTGKNMIPAYTKNPFNNALKNENVAVVLQTLIETLYKRNTSFIKAVAFLGGIIFKGEDISLGKVNASVSDADYTGTTVMPRAAVSLAGKSLTQFKDFVVTSTDTKVGKANGVIKGIGIYKGSSEAVAFNIRINKVQNLRAITSADKITLSWDTLPGAVSYKVTYDTHTYETRETTAEFSVRLGQEYTFSVVALCEDGFVSQAAAIKIRSLPETVSGVTAGDITSDSAALSWNKVQGADGYNVYVYNDTERRWELTCTAKGTNIKLDNLKLGSTYKFAVTAFVGEGDNAIEGEMSSAVQISVKPPKVTNLKASSVAAKSVKLSWKKAGANVKYEVYTIKNGKQTLYKTLSAASVTVTGLSAATAYEFRVRAVISDSVCGDFSDSVKITTLPAKVTNIKTDSVTTSSIKLSWKKNSSATHYAVYIFRNGEWERFPLTTKNYLTVKELKSGTKYKFKIRAYNSQTKTYSEDSIFYVEKTRVAKVKGLKASAIKTTSVKLTWNKVTGATGYTVYYSTDKKTWKKAKNVTGTALTVSKLKSKKTYYFKVRGYSKVDDTYTYGAYSSVIKAKTK